MFFGLYNPASGVIRKGLSGPSAEWAALNAIEGELVIESDTEIDNSRQAVDISASPHALIYKTPDKTQIELAVDVNRERSRRIEAGTVIDGVRVTGRDEDTRNLTNLALAAQLRITMGDTTPTIFRDGDNVDHELSPTQVLSLWKNSSAYVSAVYAASWALKGMAEIPQDYSSDHYWP
jgi:hypothetical protein